MHAITFLNIKGGVGKTTTAVSIAVSFGNATSMFSDKMAGKAELMSADVIRRPECSCLSLLPCFGFL